MKGSCRNFALIVILVFANGCSHPTATSKHDKSQRSTSLQRKALDLSEQKSFLSQRTSGGVIGTFDSYCSLLYAVYDVAIHTTDESINRTPLNSPFPDFYRPTWA